MIYVLIMASTKNYLAAIRLLCFIINDNIRVYQMIGPCENAKKKSWQQGLFFVFVIPLKD